MPKKVCFMVMPYGRKPTQAEAGKGPAQIDFNALWDRCYVPVIEALDYQPLRADQDGGALIITQMLERLYFADLVMADMTIANGNVYYEVGIRHAAKKTGCVMFAADWSQQLFDVAQMRTIRYPLSEGEISEATAAAFQTAIKDKIRGLAGGDSPMHLAIPGYPTAVDPGAASSMRDQLTDLAAFQTKVRAVRAADRQARMQASQQLITSDGKPPGTYPVALALVKLLCDCASNAADWGVVLAFGRGLPDEFAEQPEVRELLALAQSESGDVVQAIAALETLIDTLGPTSERLGLLGGRYKRRLRLATDAERPIWLNKSIDAYERGMDLDLNEYYCSSNLPRLYRTRKRKGDEERAQNILKLIIAACDRAMRRGVSDEWLRPTLLGAAFDAGDAEKAEELIDVIIGEGGARWKLDSIQNDLEASAHQAADAAQSERLLAVVGRLRTV